MNWQSIGKGIVGVALFIGTLFGYHQPQNLGVTVNKPVPRFESSLAIAINSSVTSSLTMISGVDGNGVALSGAMCFTIDGGITSLVEDICGTASGTVVSNLTRGLSSDGVTSNATLAHSHRVGSDIKTTDSPYLVQYYRLLSGIDGFPNPLIYANVSNASITSNNNALVSMGVLASTSLAGTVPATTANAGIAKIAQSVDLANGNTTTTYALVPTASQFSSSSKATIVPVTNSTGTLNTNFIGQSVNDTYNFLGNTSIQSSTLGTSTVNGTMTFNTPPVGVVSYFGSGTNGSTTISVTSTLTQDMYYTNLTVNAQLNTGGYKIFVNGTLAGSASGSIVAPAANNAGAAPAGGASSTVGDFTNHGGGNGSATITCNSGNENNGNTSEAATHSIGSLGGNGSNGLNNGSENSSGGGVGTVTTSTNLASNNYSTFQTFQFSDFNSPTWFLLQSGTGGGGGGSGDRNGGGGNQAQGGGGGASGFPIFLAAKVWNGTFSIIGLGGNGGNQTANSCGTAGVGGGGSGSPLFVIYQTKNYSGTITLTGGLMGTSGSTTTSQNGSAGPQWLVNVSQLTQP